MSFWSQFKLANCLPDNCGCEFVNLDAWIAQPSAFWTSAFHLIFAALLYFKTKRKTPTLKLWTFSVVLLGLSSHFAHGSFLEFAMAMDFAGIILVMSFFAFIKWLNKWVTSIPKIIFLIFCFQSGLWFTFYSLEKWFKIGLCLVIFFVSMIELMHSEGKRFWRDQELLKAIGVLALSFAVFMMDELKIWCDPHSYITGHSVWHLGTAISLYLYGKWRLRNV